MSATRRIVAVCLLTLTSVSLTAGCNNFDGMIYDYAHNLYFAGLGSLACGLCIHLCIVRRFLPLRRRSTQLLGVAISGVISILLYELFRDITAHVTFTQRMGTNINWGDEGRHSGLPALGGGFSLARCMASVPSTIFAALIYGVIWLPLLVFLERWAYAPTSSASSHRNTSQ